MRIQCFRDLLVERTCHLVLFSEFLGHLFQHFPDWKMVWTSGFAFAAAYAGGCFYPKASITVPCPICKVVAFQVACEKEGVWNADSYGTGGAVIAAAAEIGAELIADFFHFGKLLPRVRGVVSAHALIFSSNSDTSAIPGITTVTAGLEQT